MLSFFRSSIASSEGPGVVHRPAGTPTPAPPLTRRRRLRSTSQGTCVILGLLPVMPDPPAVLLAGFDVWPGQSAWARRMTEGVRASATRHRVLTLSLRGPSLAHTESLLGARALRVPPAPGSLLEQVEAFGRAVHRQLDSDAHVLVHTADPLVGAVVLGHPGRPVLLYEARRLPSSELPLLLAHGREGAVLDP